MGQFEIYIWLLGIIILVGLIANRTPAPPALLLVITGMLLSYIPHFPIVKLHEEIVLNFFLPLLVYQSSATISWRDIKNNLRPIALLSVGHVVFITLIVATVAHAMIPGLSWAAAFVLGAIVSPPDDVAIFSIAKKVQFPQRVLTVLSGESLLNDATALIIFRFSLVALMTHHFTPGIAIMQFCGILIFETLYGFLLGNALGYIRTYINDPVLQMLFSFLTPFLAYLPCVQLGGSGVLATVVTGLVISHLYLEKFTPESRLAWSSTWEMISFTLSSMLFLLVGLHLNQTLAKITAIPLPELVAYGISITLVVIIGRFIWVYPATYLPRLLFPLVRKKDPYPPWQYPFVISWAGMRGGVSLAAALAIPTYLVTIDSTDLRDIIVFLTFCVIIGTLLIQGLTLPWILKILGLDKSGNSEQGQERLQEYTAKFAIADEVSHWLAKYKKHIHPDDSILAEEVEVQIQEYQALKKRLNEVLKFYQAEPDREIQGSHRATVQLFLEIIAVERAVLATLWQDGKINFKVKTKLLQQLDLREKRYTSM